jgi:hypothetical protein
MAIRTLGEIKNAGALPALRALAGAKAPFEAEYAQAAIAAIEGKPYIRPKPPAEVLAKDPFLLPAGCGLAGQMTIPPSAAVDLAKAIKDLQPAPDPARPGMPDSQAMLAELTTALLSIAEQTGNIRLQAVTFGVAGQIGPREGYVVFLFRGQYDSAAVKQALRPMMTNTEQVSGIEVLMPRGDGDTLLILPSDQQLVLLGGPGREQLPVEEMVAAVKTGKGGLAYDGGLGKLMKTVDTTQQVWAVAKITESYRQAPLVAPFDTATLVGRQGKDGLELQLVAAGREANLVAEAVMKLQADIEKVRATTARQVQDIPALKPIADFLGSVQVKADGATATATGVLKGDTKSLLGMWVSGRHARVTSEQPRATTRPRPIPSDF